MSFYSAIKNKSRSEKRQSMYNQFFVFGSLFEHCDAMCNDLKQMPNCQFINTSNNINNKILRCIYKIHNSGIANRFFKLPLREKWYRYYFDLDRIVPERGGAKLFFVF